MFPMFRRVARPGGGLIRVASLRPIDEDDMRIVSHTIEDDVLAVWRNVECADLAVIAQARERAGLLCGEIEQAEIPRLSAGRVHQTRPIAKEAMGAAKAGPHVRQF